MIAAVVNGHTQLALGLVQGFGADINAADSSGRTALSEAARRGDTTALAGLVAAGTRLDGPRLLKEGWTALHVAAAGGHEAATTWLVSSGADLWTKDNVSAAKNVAHMKQGICSFPWTVSPYIPRSWSSWLESVASFEYAACTVSSFLSPNRMFESFVPPLLTYLAIYQIFLDAGRKNRG